MPDYTNTDSFVIDGLKTRYSEGSPKLLQVSHYQANKSPALQIRDAETGEPLLTATVCIEYSPIDGNIIIKDWSENEGIKEALIRANLIGPSMQYHPTGFCVASEHTMLNQLLGAWRAHQVEMGWTDANS